MTTADLGAVSLVSTALVTIVLSILLSVAVPALDAALRAQRATAAADLTALAVLSGSRLAGGEGQPDLAAGREVAAANGVALVAVDASGWPLGIHVQVRADIPLLSDVHASATAALRRPPAIASAGPGRARPSPAAHPQLGHRGHGGSRGP